MKMLVTVEMSDHPGVVNGAQFYLETAVQIGDKIITSDSKHQNILRNTTFNILVKDIILGRIKIEASRSQEATERLTTFRPFLATHFELVNPPPEGGFDQKYSFKSIIHFNYHHFSATVPFSAVISHLPQSRAEANVASIK